MNEIQPLTEKPHRSRRITLALTGASGVQYGLRLLECLLAQACQVDFMMSKAAHVVMATETACRWPSPPDRLTEAIRNHYAHLPGQVQAYGREDWFAPAASGSGAASRMVICPCSGSTLSALATGASNNLIERAGDVALKERRPLLLVVREMPLHQVHLENLLKLTQMGALILPASPGFYHQPQSIEDLIDFVVARLLDLLGLEQALMPRWGEARG